MTKKGNQIKEGMAERVGFEPTVSTAIVYYFNTLHNGFFHRLKLVSIVFLILSVFSGCATTQWDKKDKTLATTFVAGQAINYAQIDWLYDHDHWHEKTDYIDKIHNEFGMTGVAIWKIGATALTLKAADMFPKYRKWILGGANGVTWFLVIGDEKRGVGISINF